MTFARWNWTIFPCMIPTSFPIWMRIFQSRAIAQNAHIIHRILRPEGRIEPLKNNLSKMFNYDILMAYNCDGELSVSSQSSHTNILTKLFLGS
uniref:FI15285p1 n=1 Tax=Drosophila melanogaster TaxID=7227 RepID=A1Z793_DROME|eukprot:NP_652401.1 uncharacterized protein Dmel_CG17977 [Drosophila melanogaster]